MNAIPESTVNPNGLQVGINGKGEVVLNLGYDQTGHIVFSPTQARMLSDLLSRKAQEAAESRAIEPSQEPDKRASV